MHGYNLFKIQKYSLFSRRLYIKFDTVYRVAAMLLAELRIYGNNAEPIW